MALVMIRSLASGSTKTCTFCTPVPNLQLLWHLPSLPAAKLWMEPVLSVQPSSMSSNASSEIKGKNLPLRGKRMRSSLFRFFNRVSDFLGIHGDCVACQRCSYGQDVGMGRPPG